MKKLSLLLSTALVLSMPAFSVMGEALEADDASAVIEVATAEDLAAMNEDLTADYVLTADIDLGGEVWTPIGSFSPAGEEGEEAEMPDLAAAFTGTFNGQGHSISNFTVGDEAGICTGLFGCIANTDVGNFTVENVVSDGTVMASAVVGYSYCSAVHDVTLNGATITAHAGELSSEGMYGGVVAAGMMSTISDCTATADLTIPDGTANTGIIGGGLELTSVINCKASGTVTAGNNCYGLGGISGCGFGAEEFTGCTAENVTITAGNDCYWIGGLTGYAGGFEDESLGIPKTAVSGCTVSGCEITTGENADGVSAIVGAGFFMEGLAEAYGSDAYAEPTSFDVTDCTAENVTINGEAAEA
ncbi:MAG: hypothetical protein IJX90_08880 [Blautia sp.]|nr:hypothetical protein [Blautia sp.]